MRRINKSTSFLAGAAIAASIICQTLISCGDPATKTENKSISNVEEYRALLKKKRDQPRKLIYDNDGNDVIRQEEPIDTLYFMYPDEKAFSIPTFLSARTTPLKGSDVSTIAYCTLSSGFGQFTHHTRVGTFYQGDPNNVFPDSATYRIRTVIPDFVKLGVDPLEVVCDYAGKNGLEVFWSFRMNDTHDASWKGDIPAPLWTKFKADHPEYLFGNRNEKLPYGAWSAVNFARPEIRDLAIKFFTEVCENYDVDGIELDFFRHLHLFKSVANGGLASQEELDMLTDMVAKIREMTEKVGMKKGKPILVSVRLPDSFEYCRSIGLDLENWIKKGLVDIVIGSCYFRLNPWSYLVKAGEHSDVKMYAGLSESRIQNEHPLLQRNKNHVYRARAAGAWQAGVDGLYSLNEYNPKAGYLSEIGDPQKLKNTNKLYFVTDVCPPHNVWNSPSGYLKNGESLYNIPIVTPENPVKIDAAPLTWPMELGDEHAPAAISLILYTKDIDPKGLIISLNKTPLEYRKTSDSGLSVFNVSPAAVKPGRNELSLEVAPSHRASSKNGYVRDAALFFLRDSTDQDVKKLAGFCAE